MGIIYLCRNMSDINSLKNKLIAGKNEQKHGYKAFMQAQFYGKLFLSLIGSPF